MNTLVLILIICALPMFILGFAGKVTGGTIIVYLLKTTCLFGGVISVILILKFLNLI